MADSDPTDAVQADQPVVSGAASLMRLPNELLFGVGSLLCPGDMARLMRTSRFFYQLLVNTLYQRDADNKTSNNDNNTADKDCSCCSSALRWGCLTSNVDTMKRALAVPGIDMTLSWPHTFAMALDTSCPSPVTTLLCLLGHGLPINVPIFRDRYGKPIDYGPSSSLETFWPLLADILYAASQAPRWCPIPVIACCFEGGATLAVGDTSAAGSALRHLVSSVWDHVLRLVQVRGPRQWKYPHSTVTQLRHDHCLHDGVACNVAVTRVLLRDGKADSNVVFPVRHVERYSLSAPNDSLLVRAVSDPRRPVELLQCLADAGANLQKLCEGGRDLPSPPQLGLLSSYSTVS
ncbi:hypothetical protein Sste5346_005086 [Sporothrix stenoceras]|uniref:F-box domain-containing protein n=1 Tax=Sporothrix stenoceras TaxID=5173 RepID=A0ABR3Z5Y1_9PEZI